MACGRCCNGSLSRSLSLALSLSLSLSRALSLSLSLSLALSLSGLLNSTMTKGDPEKRAARQTILKYFGDKDAVATAADVLRPKLNVSPIQFKRTIQFITIRFT